MLNNCFLLDNQTLIFQMSMDSFHSIYQFNQISYILLALCQKMHTKVHYLGIPKLNVYIIPPAYFFHHLCQCHIVKIEKAFFPIQEQFRIHFIYGKRSV